MSSATRELVAQLCIAFDAEKKCGEVVDCWRQSPESFARLDARVRQALLGALETGGGEAFKPYGACLRAMQSSSNSEGLGRALHRDQCQSGLRREADGLRLLPSTP